MAYSDYSGAINGVDDPTQPGRKRLKPSLQENVSGASGAINGVNDPTQSVYRNPQRFVPPSTNSADIAELNNTLADVNNPASPNSPLGRKPVTPTSAAPQTTNNVPQRNALPYSYAPGSTAETNARFAMNAKIDGGQKLPDGSYAFSNVKGQPGYLDSKSIADLGNRVNTIPAANFTAPGVGTQTGVATTPPAGFGQSNDVGFNMDPTAVAQRTAQSNIASIFNKDPRSAFGIAARNAQVDLGDIKSPRSRSGAGGPTPYQQAISDLVGRANADVTETASQQNDREKNATSLALENQRGQNEMAKEGARSIAELNKPEYQTDANGNLVRVSGTNAQTVNREGNPLAVQSKINGPLEKIHGEIYNRAIASGMSPEDAQAAADAYRPPGKGAQATQPKQPAVPKNGEVRNGYRFKGGNPADKNNWEKVA